MMKTTNTSFGNFFNESSQSASWGNNNSSNWNSNWGNSNSKTGSWGHNSNNNGNSYSKPTNASRSSSATNNYAHTTTIKKDNYHPQAHVLQRPKAEVDNWLAVNDVKLSGRHDLPNPITSFAESTFPAQIVSQLLSSFQQPTPIQSISWPVALSGNDLISIAKTGSGKTLGFVLPAIVHVMNQAPRRSGDGPTILVLLPTRELALQVEAVACEYSQLMGLQVSCCYGGSPKGPQLGALRRGIDICIATPGRLNDFLETRATSMGRCSFVVLDEADRMLDMGFEPQIRKILSSIRTDRQTLMFSATWPKEVRKLASDFLTNEPVHLTVGSLELSANHNIEQNIEVINEYRKPERLTELLQHIQTQDQSKTIIFVATKRTADQLTRQVRQGGFPALCIHGDKDQHERNWVLSQFREGKATILLATDVAARGIDVSDIKFVINYDYPNNSEDYVHRIGRTGRAAEQGTAYTFFTSDNGAKASDLIKVLTEANQNIPEELSALASMGYRDKSSYNRRSGGGGKGEGGAGSGKRKWGENSFGGGGGYNNGGQSKRGRFSDNGNRGGNQRGSGGGGYGGGSGRGNGGGGYGGGGGRGNGGGRNSWGGGNGRY